MSQRKIQVAAQRTFVTPRGRKFVPREPKRFEVTLESNGDPYTTLRDNVTSQFLRLGGQYHILYKDINDELQTIEDRKSLEEAMNSMNNEILSVYVQGESTPGPWHGMPQAGTVPHCSNCNDDIDGVRTKCLECEDYNLCGQCEAQGLHVHHVMIRSDRPQFFFFGLPRCADVIPALCEQQKQNATDPENLPRLGAKNLHQFRMSQKLMNDIDDDDDDDTRTYRGQRGHHRHHHMRGMWRHFDHNMSDQEQSHTRMEGPPRGGPFWLKHMDMPHTTCSECNNSITGVQIKCLECQEFYLCKDCDSKDLHSSHVMVECDRPRFFHFALTKFGDTIAELCTQHKGKYEGADKIPRLQAKEVRQFWYSKRKQNNHDINRCDEGNPFQGHGPHARGIGNPFQGHGPHARWMENPFQGHGPHARWMGNPFQGHGPHARWMGNPFQGHGPHARFMEMGPMFGDNAHHPVHLWEHVQMDNGPQCNDQSSGEEMETGDKGGSPCIEKPNLQQMKQQWMQKCKQVWRKKKKVPTATLR